MGAGNVMGLCEGQRKPKARYRRVPGFRKQFTLLLRRAGVKWVRNWGLKFVDLLLFAGAALCVGEPTFRLHILFLIDVCDGFDPHIDSMLISQAYSSLPMLHQTDMQARNCFMYTLPR